MVIFIIIEPPLFAKFEYLILLGGIGTLGRLWQIFPYRSIVPLPWLPRPWPNHMLNKRFQFCILSWIINASIEFLISHYIIKSIGWGGLDLIIIKNSIIILIDPVFLVDF